MASHHLTKSSLQRWPIPVAFSDPHDADRGWIHRVLVRIAVALLMLGVMILNVLWFVGKMILAVLWFVASIAVGMAYGAVLGRRPPR